MLQSLRLSVKASKPISEFGAPRPLAVSLWAFAFPFLRVGKTSRAVPGPRTGGRAALCASREGKETACEAGWPRVQSGFDDTLRDPRGPRRVWTQFQRPLLALGSVILLPNCKLCFLSVCLGLFFCKSHLLRPRGSEHRPRSRTCCVPHSLCLILA